jgi:hypothetical protein
MDTPAFLMETKQPEFSTEEVLGFFMSRLHGECSCVFLWSCNDSYQVHMLCSVTIELDGIVERDVSSLF